MRKIKRKLNVARLSGYRGSEVPEALKSFSNSPRREQTQENEGFKANSEEARIRLRAAGYKVS